MEFPSSDTWADAITGSLLGENTKGGATDFGDYGYQRLTGVQSARRRVYRLARELPYWRFIDTIGIIVDRRAKFTYHGFEFLRPIYQALPDDEAAWPDFSLTIMKAAQCGASIFALGVPLYVSARLGGFSTTYFLPDQASASKMSGERFMELIRPNPELYQILQESNVGTSKNEGSKHLRRFGSSFLFFGYLGGSMQTESMPLDLLIFDEVQQMTPVQMEKARERVAASKYKMTLRLSTALMPDSDIHAYFKLSDQRYWHTRCHCSSSDPEQWVVLSEIWPDCVGEGNGTTPGVPKGFFYRCPRCSTLITNPRRGRYVAHLPENAPNLGFHFAQTLLATLTPAQLMTKYRESRDLQNFHNRCLGRPYEAEDRIPINWELLKHKVFREDLQWVHAPRAGQVRGGLMGIDHMGGFCVVTILARTSENHYRIVWLELIESDEPFVRCDQLMEEYGVQVCTIENLPNYNEARRFARRHYGRVWIVNYQVLAGEMMLWKDKSRMNASQARTDPDEELPYNVGVDQFRLMSYALGMVTAGLICAPDPEKYPLMAHASVQPFVANRLKAGQINIAEHAMRHLSRVALITQDLIDPLNHQRKPPYVQKIGIDPHFAYSFMLAVLATIRAYGCAAILDLGSPVTTADMMAEGTMTKRTESGEAEHQQMQPLFDALQSTAPLPERCATCSYLGPARDPGWHLCRARRIQIRAADAACPAYLAGPPVPKADLGDLATTPSISDLIDTV